MNDSFLNKAQTTDERVIYAVVVYSLNDLNMIRSLLYSSKIENYVKNNHVSTLYPGVGIDGLNSMIISIFENDYESTREIVNDYLAEKKKERGENTAKDTGNRIRNVGEFIVTGRFVSSNKDSKDPEILPHEDSNS
jgi:hypothetical protein